MIVKNRIKKHSEFKNVIETGVLKRTNSLKMYYLQNTYGYTRIGISVPKKSGNAVVRNKIKRQIRSACVQVLNLNNSVDIVFVARKEFDIKNFSKTLKEISELSD